MNALRIALFILTKRRIIRLEFNLLIPVKKNETENCLYIAASDEVLMERVFPCPIRNQIFRIKKFLEVEKK